MRSIHFKGGCGSGGDDASSSSISRRRVEVVMQFVLCMSCMLYMYIHMSITLTTFKAGS